MENSIVHGIESRIFTVRGMQVMLDRDLAELYGVSTSRLNEQVSRNKGRFPATFCFHLSTDEMRIWISQNAISKSIRMSMRKPPRVFTEFGVAMASSVLNSTQAIEVSVQIIQSFVLLKKAIYRLQMNALQPIRHPESVIRNLKKAKAPSPGLLRCLTYRQ